MMTIDLTVPPAALAVALVAAIGTITSPITSLDENTNRQTWLGRDSQNPGISKIGLREEVKNVPFSSNLLLSLDSITTPVGKYFKIQIKWFEDRPPPFFYTIAIATVVLEVWALQGNQIKMQKVRSWSRGMLCVQVSIAVVLWSSPPCNRARPLRPRSRPCHHTWERGVTLLCWFLRCFCLIFVVLFACLIPEGQESENRVKMDKRPGCLRKTTRSSTGTRELVRTAGCKQWSWWRRLVFSTRAVKLVSSIVTIWSSVTPKNRTKMMIRDVHHHQDSTLWEPRYKPPPHIAIGRQRTRLHRSWSG